MSSKETKTERPVQFSDAELLEKLTPEQYNVTQAAGTEQAFTGRYWDSKTAGVYRCVVCEAELFESSDKFESGSGWPSFTQAINDDRVERNVDRSFGMKRTEALCADCGAHLGHVFDDGPAPTGERFCMNSASLNLIAASDD